MPVLHRREDGSGLYVRARLAGNWITWQVTSEGEQWLQKSGFGDGDSIDLELLEMLQDKRWLYTGGSGAGIALESGRPSFLQVGEGVKHHEYGIGQIKEILKDGNCRVGFYREYPETREVRADELSAARSIELARERSAAYERSEQAKKAAITKATISAAGVPGRPDARAHTNPTATSRAQPEFRGKSAPPGTAPPSSGCLSFLAVATLLALFFVAVSIA